jgi:hypothetical protein
VRLFGKSKREQARPDQGADGNDRTEAQLAPLQIALGIAVFQTETAILEFANYPTGSEVEFRVNSWAVRLILFTGYLHLIQRFAFAVGGSAARDPLQDFLTINGIRELARASHGQGDSSTTQKFDDWLDRMIADAVEGVGDFDASLSECLTIVLPNPMDETAVLGRVASEVAKIFDLEDDPVIRVEIWSAISRGLAENHLKGQTELAIR